MNYTIDTRLWTPVEMRSEQRVWLAYEMGRCGAGIDVMTALDQAVPGTYRRGLALDRRRGGQVLIRLYDGSACTVTKDGLKVVEDGRSLNWKEPRPRRPAMTGAASAALFDWGALP